MDAREDATRGKNEWLLIKERDAYAISAAPRTIRPDSMLSGQTVERDRGGKDRAAPRRRAA